MSSLADAVTLVKRLGSRAAREWRVMKGKPATKVAEFMAQPDVRESALRARIEGDFTVQRLNTV